MVRALLVHCPALTRLVITKSSVDFDLALRDVEVPLVLQNLRCDEECLMTSAGVVSVARCMPNLDLLCVEVRERVTDGDVLALVQGCPRISNLSLGPLCDLSDSALTTIGEQAAALRTIYVDHCLRVSGDGLRAVTAATPLAVLSIRHLRITDSDLRVVGRQCKSLNCLYVSGCSQLTDAAFDTLNPRVLRVLDVSETKVTGSFAATVCSSDSQVFSLLANSCPGLTGAFVQAVLPGNQLESLELTHARFVQSEWLQLSERLPELSFFVTKYASGVDEAVVRAFLLPNKPRLYRWNVTGCNLPGALFGEFKCLRKDSE